MSFDHWSMVIKREWKDHLRAHPDQIGGYEHWLKQRLITALKRNHQLYRAIQKLKGEPNEEGGLDEVEQIGPEKEG